MLWQVVRVESLGGSEVEASGDEFEGLATGTSSDIEVWHYIADLRIA